MIDNKLQFYQTRAGYDAQKNAGNIPNDALVFVKDTHEIITHGEEDFGNSDKYGDIAYLGDQAGTAVTPEFNPQDDTVWTKDQVLSDDKKDTVQANILNKIAGDGMGKVVLKRNMVSGVNTLTQDMFYKTEDDTRVPNTDTIFVIKYDYTLAEDVTIPANCILVFDGGSISGEYTITGTNTGIEANLVKIFSKDITLDGTFDCNAVYPEWFGAVNGISVDSSDAIQKTLDTAVTINIPVEFGRTYKIEKVVNSSYRTIIFKDTVFFTNVKRDFAFVLSAIGDNEGIFCEIRGNAAFINQDTSFDVISQTVTYPANANVPIGTVENPSQNVSYTDFTVNGAKVGDIVYIKRGSESEFIRFSGEVISDNTVRIYVNNHYVSAIPIEDTSVKLTILSGCCHGINLGGTFTQTGNLRCVKYTGLSFGLGNRLDEECGIRYKANSKVYYSTMNVNLFPAGGIGFRCAGSNNVNNIFLSIFSVPYSSNPSWPRTYAYIGLSLSGIGNVFENLAVEGTYHDYAISLGLAMGNKLGNIYTEFVTSETYPNGKRLYTSAYSSGNRFSYCYESATQDDDVLGLNNIIEVKANYYVGSNGTTMNKAEINLLRDVNFEYGILTSGSGQYGRWYFWGSNCTFTKVDGIVPNTKALRVDATNGRLILQQRILWNANIPDLKNINTNLCFSVWVRSNKAVSGSILSGAATFKNGFAAGDEKWHLLVCPTCYYNGYIQVDLRWSPDTALTGYVELFNPRLTLGSESLGIVDDEVKYALDNHGTTRPINVPIGHCFLDETAGKPIWWNGTAWVDATGATV